MMRAALAGDTGAVKDLVSKGADVSAKDNEGRTALMFAVINIHRETVKVLLDRGADVNARANDGGTALMLATSGGDGEIVQMLLRKGADVRGAFEATGKTAHELAAEKGYATVVELLRKARANT